MYLLIFEDLSVGKTNKITDDDYKMYDAGIIEIFNISDPKYPLMYVGDNGWKFVDDAKDVKDPE